MNKETQTAKEIIKKISSGGFIFHLDKKSSAVSVLLIKHTNGEVWIPKGKLESEESQIDAAYREIKEEVGIEYDQLRYIDLCATDSYSYDIDEKQVMHKDLYINVFSVETKLTPHPTDWHDLDSVDWYPYSNALDIIAFNKLELKKAYEIFMKSIHQVNRLVDIALEKTSADISKLPCAKNITCVYLYGSIYKKIHKIDTFDTDMTIVIKDEKIDISPLFLYLQKYFENIDFHLYTNKEINNDLSFYTREFVLEYVTKGLCVYGNNKILIDQYHNVTREQYVKSIFIRSVEYLQLVRAVYYSNKYTNDYKLRYIKKYATRLARCIILIKGYSTWDELEIMTPNQIIKMLSDRKHISSEFKKDVMDLELPLEYYFKLFCEIGGNLHKTRPQLEEKS
ncbi:MAG: NUDIX domain-containing protein [Candidatus Taylorbacteria bacterium]|nr:NUDIX domain-containing protein [Candidatus Taylorbacteria bacterium]